MRLVVIKLRRPSADDLYSNLNRCNLRFQCDLFRMFLGMDRSDCGTETISLPVEHLKCYQSMLHFRLAELHNTWWLNYFNARIPLGKEGVF